MPNNCDTTEHNAQVLKDNEEIKEAQFKADTGIVTANEPINAMLAKKFGLGKEISSKELLEVYKEKYPDPKKDRFGNTLADHHMFVDGIQALLSANQEEKWVMLEKKQVFKK